MSEIFRKETRLKKYIEELVCVKFIVGVQQMTPSFFSQLKHLSNKANDFLEFFSKNVCEKSMIQSIFTRIYRPINIFMINRYLN